MKRTSTLFALAFAFAAALAVAAGCGAPSTRGFAGASDAGLVPHLVTNTPTPAPKKLYVDHAGVLYLYALPLHAGAKPLFALKEDPGQTIRPPQIAVDPFGKIAIATSTEIRFFKPPIVSFDPKRAQMILPLNPAITPMNAEGADLADMEYDPNANLWLVNNLGGGLVTELTAPVQKHSVARIFIAFNVPGTKTNGYTPAQARFDVNATLYVYAEAANGAVLFKSGFPYAKPPSPTGLSIAQADFVDASQYAQTDPNPKPVILGQYVGILASPPPQQPPPPPVDALAQFALPLNPVVGFFPDATADAIVGALVADPQRTSFYTLDAGNGRLSLYALPMKPHATPAFSLDCRGGTDLCNGKSEHLFLAP